MKQKITVKPPVNSDEFSVRKWQEQVSTKFNEEQWVTPTLQNSWVNYSAEYTPAGFRKRSDGVVEIRGMVKNGSAVNATIFTLPEGYRPKHRLLLANISNQLVGRIDILANGQVQQQVGSTAWLSLDGITFYAEQ